MSDRLLSIREVCRRTGIGRERISEAIRRGELDAVKLARARRPLLRPVDVEKWLMGRAEKVLSLGTFFVALVYKPHDGGAVRTVGMIDDPQIVASVERSLLTLHAAGLSELRSPLELQRLGDATPDEAADPAPSSPTGEPDAGAAPRAAAPRKYDS